MIIERDAERAEKENIMDILDALSRGMGRLADKLDAYTGSHLPAGDDTSFSVLDKAYCWEDLDYAGDYTLQRHVVNGNCRIIDKFGTVVDRGTQEQLEQSMTRRAAQAAAQSAALREAGVIPAGGSTVQPVQAQYGDIIGVVRRNGAYEHYGIYLSDTCIVHYAIPASMTIGHATVHATDLRNFLRSDTEYFVLDFPRPYEPPVRIGSSGSTPHTETVSEELARHLQQQYGYHLYSPEETVARARSRLGETNYNLLTNNCEHFVIWCKTGVSESMQISGMFRSLRGAQGWQFRKPAFR